MPRWARGWAMRSGSAAGAAYAGVVALVLAGCGYSGTSTTDRLLGPGARVSGPPTPLMAVLEQRPFTPGEEVARVGLRSVEIPAAQRVRWPGPGQVARGPLLGPCVSDRVAAVHRVARRTVTGTVPYSGVWFVDQALVYDSQASARVALRQVRRAAVRCATSAVRVTANPAGLPVAASYVMGFRAAGPDGNVHVLVVAQQRGDVVDVLSVSGSRRVSKGQHDVLLREANDTGSRMAGLPLASTGA